MEKGKKRRSGKEANMEKKKKIENDKPCSF